MPSKSKAQRNFMAAAAHNPKFAKKVGVPTKVAKEFNNADTGKKFNKGGNTMKHTDVKMDKKVAKKAMSMHDKQQHGGKKTNLTKLKDGGKVEKQDKSFITKAKEYILGTPEQNKKAAAEMKAQDKKNPDSVQAKINKHTKYSGYKAGGSVKSASRGSGCEVRGKTKGRMV
jgi:hypothetical protein